MKKKRQDKTTKINIPLKKILTEKNEYYLILFLLVAVSALFSSFLFDDPGTLGEGDWV